MNVKYTYFVAVIFAFCFSSCCTKKYCPAIEGLSMILLSGFSLEETDSITIETYSKERGFANRSDSFFTTATPWETNHLAIFLPGNVNENMDYRLTLISTGKLYTLTNITTVSRTCNSCFPNADDKYKILDNYSVDGVIIKRSSLLISK